ncbi:MAG: lipid-binding SYLF domain-containing protein [Woeseiaceae bacterium]|nr:lipid-binding SYLF domain-containing protein [Woeseiaceae bacterium]
MNTQNKAVRLGSMLFALLLASSAVAASAKKIDLAADEALQVFRKQVSGADVFLNQAAGYLVFPRVIKVGVVIGAESGEGVLRVRGRTVDYYRTTSGSFGLQLGAQAKSIVIAFMTQESLQKFRNSTGWKVGIDGSVALIDMGAGKTIDSDNIRDPVVGFIFGSKGLMYNLTLEGSKFSKLDKSE